MHMIPILLSKGEKQSETLGHEPMIGGDGSSILHFFPLRPGFDGIRSRIPDLLAPNNIFEVENGTVLHNPFGDGYSRCSLHLWSCLNPHVSRNRTWSISR